MIVIQQGGEWLWQNVRNIPNSLKRMRCSIAWIIQSYHFARLRRIFGISESALKNWMKAAKEHEGSVPTRGSGNYASDEAKEIARLQRELRDTKDALEVLKKQSVFWENDRNSLHGYFWVRGGNKSPACETSSFCQRNTEKLDVSRSGYHAWKKRVPSDTSVRRAVLKEKIQKIYEDSHQNYGAPKITAELRKSGERVSEKTVGNYMRQMGIKAQWVKPYIQTTIDSDFSQELKKYLKWGIQSYSAWCCLVFWHHVYLDVWRICISYQRYGSVFEENHFLGVEWDAGGFPRSGMYWKSKTSQKC